MPLHHLAMRTRDVDGLVTFYRVWLDLPIARDERPRAVWLALQPGAVLMVERAEPDEPGVPAQSRELVAFAVDASARLSLRARLIDAALLESETAHTLYFRDPDGRRLGVSSYPL